MEPENYINYKVPKNNIQQESKGINYREKLHTHCQKTQRIYPNLLANAKQIGGPPHAPLFQASVIFDDEEFVSDKSPSKDKAADDLAKKLCMYLKIIPLSEEMKQRQQQMISNNNNKIDGCTSSTSRNIPLINNSFNAGNTSNLRNSNGDQFDNDDKLPNLSFQKLSELKKAIIKQKQKVENLTLVLVDIENSHDLFQEVYIKYKDIATIIIVKTLGTPMNVPKNPYNSIIFTGQTKCTEAAKATFILIIGALFDLVNEIILVSKSATIKAVKEIINHDTNNLTIYSEDKKQLFKIYNDITAFLCISLK